MDRILQHYAVGSNQDHPQEKEMEKSKMVIWGVLKIAEKRREAGGKGKKERYTHLNSEFQRTRRDKKSFLSDQRKEIEEKHRREILDISSRKLEIPKEYFIQRWAQ